MGIYTNMDKILTKGLRLPALLLQQGRCPGQRPLPQTATGILFGQRALEDVAPARHQPWRAQYLRSSFEECFVYIKLPPDHEVWIGPMLTAPVGEGRLAEIIRAHKLPIREKPRLAEYYAGLPLVNEEEYFYAGQIAQELAVAQEEGEALPAIEWEEQPAPVFSARLDAEKRLTQFQHPPYFLELEMTRLVTAGDIESALETMNRINAFNRAILAKDPVRSLKNSLICDCTFLARAAIAGGVSPDEAFALSDKLILQAEHTVSIAELERQERQNLIEFVELVHTYNATHYSKPVREAIGYIGEHLTEKFSLAQLASRVYMHPNYLCGLFKKETGQTLSNYILCRRVEEAKFFLRFTDNSVAEIAAFYQFSSQSYFIHRFKQIEGKTPLQYRNSCDR